MRIIGLLAVLMPSICAAETICVKVVTETCTDGYCQRSTEYGSAVVVSQGQPGEWRAITADHVLEHSRRGNTWVAVGGEWRPVVTVHRVRDAGDSAFVAFHYDGQLKTVATVENDSEIQAGDRITFDGFAEGSTYREVAGEVLSNGVARCTAKPVRGQSGGGVYRNGVLIGTVTGFGIETGNLVYEPVGRFRQRCVRAWGFWIATCRPVRPQRQVVEIAPPPPPERPVPTVPAVPKTPPVPAQPATPVVTTEDVQGLRTDLEKLRTELAAVRATKIPVQVLAADGSVFSQETVNLGDPIKLRLVPKQK